MFLLTINYPFNVFNTPAELFVIFRTIIYYFLLEIYIIKHTVLKYYRKNTYIFDKHIIL